MIRRLMVATAIIGTNLLVGPAAEADPPPADTVTGSGIALTGEAFEIDAQSRANGDHARGSMTITIVDASAAGTVTARVECLSISGNEAVIGGIVTKSSSVAFSRKDAIQWFVRDDDLDDLRVQPTDGVSCSTTPTVNPIQSGSITIVDN